ncbi:uncharacterized protein LOC129774113 [Toxorhynchites rutilus septentrionalis]|uniref:uncharacterized protein LOC129774113 n=1 Tax=Toxorhynchites rutilus septentrionalis TaxID=329112 RepID=UPI00247AFC23|nr:uncharacterized protein LOC129774113 [Toxorhynchites rutilus septentrionalis]
MAEWKQSEPCNEPCDENIGIQSITPHSSKVVCIVPGCRTRNGQGYSFHNFPPKADRKRYKVWLTKLRLNYEPSPSSKACSLHFSITNFVVPTARRLTERMILKRTAIPDINLPKPICNTVREIAAKNRAERAARRNEFKPDLNHYMEDSQMSICDDTEDAIDIITAPDFEQAAVITSPDFVQAAVITSPDFVEAAVQVDTLDLDKLFIGRRRTMSVHFKTDSELNSWTGLASLKMLDTIVEGLCSLAAYKKRSHSTVPVEEEVLVVFVKMKTNISFSCMSALFNLHYQTISQVFYRTVPLLKMMCTPLVPWPTQEEVNRNMPHYFRPYYTDVIAVLDCTEMPIKKPKCLHCRINAYSHYKGRETAKYLIAVTPGGTICYISHGYGGKASDKQIVTAEKLLEKFKIGEAVMTDKGFSIDTECKALGVKLVRPPFLTAPRYQLSTMDARVNVSIAASRVHVERAIQRIKIFEIFNNKLDTRFLPILDDLIYIACGIVNISKPILSNERF